MADSSGHQRIPETWRGFTKVLFREYIRVPPEIHVAAAMAAKVHGKSLNHWAAKALKNAADTR